MSLFTWGICRAEGVKKRSGSRFWVRIRHGGVAQSIREYQILDDAIVRLSSEYLI